MKTRFNEKAKILDIVMMAVSVMLSVGVVLYGINHFGFSKTWPELILNTFYVACIVMIWMYFFNYRITTKQFNYWCSVSIGMTVLLRDILCPPPLANYPLRAICFTLSVLLLCTLTYFYARKEWQTYTKKNLWFIFAIDTLIAVLYHINIAYFEVTDEYTNYFLTEIWIRPTITYGLVTCFVADRKEP